MSTLHTPPNFPSLEGLTCPHGITHPSVRIQEYVEISKDLAARLTSRPNHIAVFANSTDTGPQSSGISSSYAEVEVPIPFPSNDGYNRTNGTNWDTIVSELLKLKKICESGKQTMFLKSPNFYWILSTYICVSCIFIFRGSYSEYGKVDT